MTITLTTELEAILREQATAQGREPNELAEAVLAAGLCGNHDFDPGVEEAVEEALQAAREGRERPWTEFLREHRERYPDL